MMIMVLDYLDMSAFYSNEKSAAVVRQVPRKSKASARELAYRKWG